MARATILSAPSDLYLIAGEQPDTDDPEDARQWVTIYRELVTFAERTLSRLRNDVRNGHRLTAEPSDADESCVLVSHRITEEAFEKFYVRRW